MSTRSVPNLSYSDQSSDAQGWSRPRYLVVPAAAAIISEGQLHVLPREYQQKKQALATETNLLHHNDHVLVPVKVSQGL